MDRSSCFTSGGMKPTNKCPRFWLSCESKAASFKRSVNWPPMCAARVRRQKLHSDFPLLSEVYGGLFRELLFQAAAFLVGLRCETAFRFRVQRLVRFPPFVLLCANTVEQVQIAFEEGEAMVGARSKDAANGISYF